MTVLCIDATPRSSDFEGPRLKSFSDYSVKRECMALGSDNIYYPCYELREFPGLYFDTDRFIPVGAQVFIAHQQTTAA
jgi:hypothetical protein